jgi:hypothetical protein
MSGGRIPFLAFVIDPAGSHVVADSDHGAYAKGAELFPQLSPRYCRSSCRVTMAHQLGSKSE